MQKNDLWKTPEDLLRILRKAFVDNIFIDACPDQKDYEDYVAGNYKGVFYRLHPDDALDYDLRWGYSDDCVVFMNPPYSGKYKEEFINRALYEEEENYTPVIALFPASVETAWFKEIEEKSTLVWYLGKRVSFVDPVTGKSGAGNRSGSVIFILDKCRKIVNKRSVEDLCKENPYGGYGYYRSEEAPNVGFHFRVSS
jgi:phage N-6-adenine-methyltransferase